MLNLIQNKMLSSSSTQFKDNKRIKSSKHFPRSTREWKNSIYLYNKNNLNLIPSTDLSVMNIIKSYFRLFNKELENKARTKRISFKYRKPSTHKIYVGNQELEHTNNQVTLDLYLHNRQINNYSIAMKLLKVKYLKIFKYYKKFFSRRLDLLEKWSITFLRKKKLFLMKSLKQNSFNERISNYTNAYSENLLSKHLNKEFEKILLYWCYRQLIYINWSKYTYIYLQYLKEQIYKIYNKQVEFNLINLKKFYFSSDIISEIITKRISGNRNKIAKYLKSLKNKVKIVNKKRAKSRIIRNNKLNKKNSFNWSAYKSSNSLIKIIRKNLKYKNITGFRLEAKGRLTKRNKASRSILKVINKGNLINTDSSLKGLSSVTLRGNLNSNTQYSKLSSKSNIGSFGIKIWINSN